LECDSEPSSIFLAEFDMDDRCIVSPLRGQNPQIWPAFRIFCGLTYPPPFVDQRKIWRARLNMWFAIE